MGAMSFKSAESETKVPSEWDIKAEQSVDRWTEILDRGLERLFERQERVVLEKASGAKARKAISNGSLTVDNIFDQDTWNKQMAEDMKPIITAILKEASENVAAQANGAEALDEEQIKAYVDDQVARMQKANETTKEEITAAIISSLAMRDSEEDSHALLKAALAAIFVYLLLKRKRRMAEHEAQSAYNAGVWFTADSLGEKSMKTWLTRRDSRVRAEHAVLHGKSVSIGSGFAVGDSILRFPGDPLAPPNLTVGCRCRLKFGN